MYFSSKWASYFSPRQVNVFSSFWSMTLLPFSGLLSTNYFFIIDFFYNNIEWIGKVLFKIKLFYLKVLQLQIIQILFSLLIFPVANQTCDIGLVGNCCQKTSKMLTTTVHA